MKKSRLAIHGGEKAVTLDQTEAQKWPIITDEEIQAVTNVLRKGELSISEETYKLEEEFAKYHGVKYALAHNNGTAAIHAAFFAIGVGPGDEVISPAHTYWATFMPILSTNGVPVFCEVDPDTLCADPDDIRKRITPQTKAIIVVHQGGMMAEMDKIMEIAREKAIPVVEDASHAHGATYKGKKAGTIGDIGCFSLQTSKLLPGGEGGILITNNLEYYERAVCLGHYERISKLPEERYQKYMHTGFGWKYRISPLTAAIARVQFKHLDEGNDMRTKQMGYLLSGLKGLKGIHPIEAPPYVKRVYYGGPRIRYSPKELGGISKDKLVEALRAEGANVGTGEPLRAVVAPPRGSGMHLQPVFQERNLYGKGCPFDCPHVKRKILYRRGDLPITEALPHDKTIMSLPPFKAGASRELLDQYILAFKKVTENIEELL